MRLLNRFEPPSHQDRATQDPAVQDEDFRSSGDSFSYRQVVSARPQRSRSQLDGFPPALGFRCGGGVLALATLYALPALRKSPPPANSIRSQSNDSQPAPRQEALPNTTPSNTAPAAAPSLNQRQSRPSRFQPSKPKNAGAADSIFAQARRAETSRRIRRLYRQDIPGLLKKAEADAGLEITKTARREFDIVLHLDPNNQAAKTGMSRLHLSVGRK